MLLKLCLLIFLFSFNPSQGASLIGTCLTNVAASDCPSGKLFFPAYAKNSNTGKYPFKYKIDRGGLGEIDEATASSSTITILDDWEAVSNLDFQQAGTGTLDFDVTGSRYRSILEPNDALGFSPIVFDDDGSITDALFGTGSKRNVLGFAGATFFDVSGGRINSIGESQSVFNGFLFDRDHVGGTAQSILNEFQTTILHEFAHMFGLDHTQGGNLEGFLNDSDQTDVPVMFPIASNPLVELQHDDIASVKAAYPLSTDSSNYARITGKLLKNGSPIKGASIVAYKVDDTNPRKKAVACPADVDGLGEGNFVLPNLEPGTYIVKAEPLNEDFTGGSGVGIYDPISSSKMKTGFYQGDNEAILETNNLNSGIAQALRLTLAAGESSNIFFETEADGDNGTQLTPTFTLGGKAINKNVFLKFFKSTRVKMNITNISSSKKTIRLSTDYTDLISFFPQEITIEAGVTKKTTVVFASYLSFLSSFSDLEDIGSARIDLTAEDLDTGYINDNEFFTVE